MKLVARIKGGLGNQLFCYAAARRLAIANQAELVLDPVSGFVRDIEYQRKYRLDGFSIPAKLASPSERLEPFERIRRAFIKFKERSRPYEQRRYIEQEFSDFDSRLLNRKLQAPVTVIDGLWQSTFYFYDITDILRTDLIIKPPTDNRNYSAVQWIKKNQAVAIHVRCYSTAGSSGNVQEAYYRAALSLVADKIKKPYFAIFSDDPQYAISLLNLPQDRTLVVDWNENEGGEIIDFWLMKNCKHFIIANSTFSWWAAWLGARSADQLVFFPRRDVTIMPGWAWDYKGQMPIHWIDVTT